MFIYSFVIYLWSEIKNVIEDLYYSKNVSYEYKKMKKNETVFKQLQREEKKYNFELLDNYEILLGNKKAKIKITVVISPTCKHCKRNIERDSYWIFKEKK